MIKTCRQEEGLRELFSLSAIKDLGKKLGYLSKVSVGGEQLLHGVESGNTNNSGVGY